MIIAKTYYRSRNPLRMDDLFSGVLDRFGLQELTGDSTDSNYRMLSDGQGVLWVHADEDYVTSLAGRSWQIQGMLAAIEETFETTIISEHKPEYWGFADQKEWEAWLGEMARKDQNAFHTDLLLYVRGQPNGISPGTVGALKAEIAKDLAERDPSVLLPENKDRWLADIDKFYQERHTVTLKLTEDEIGQAILAAFQPANAREV